MADFSWKPGKKSPLARKKLGASLKKKPELPVTCGNKEGILHKDRFNKSEPCILSEGQWFTPTEFEKFGGKERNKKWKASILHNTIQLLTFIQDGFLSSPSFKTKRPQDQENRRKKLIRPRRSTRHSKNSRTSESVSTSDWSSESDCNYDDDDDDDDDHDNDHDNDDNDNIDALATELNVTCSRGEGVLHVTRFATETCGKCIRTEDAWLTPKQFLNQNKTNGNWRRDIVSCNYPLGELIMRRVLKPHRVNCKCPICKGDRKHLLDQKNDDVCFMCNQEGDLVCCGKCPRAFHHDCHEPACHEVIGDHWTCSFCI